MLPSLFAFYKEGYFSYGRPKEVTSREHSRNMTQSAQGSEPLKSQQPEKAKGE
jgi:hypothetical protein